MPQSLDHTNRKVVPRWRDSRLTISLHELDFGGAPANHVLPDEDFRQKITDWQAHKTFPYAADLVSAAVVLGRHDQARSAAEFILGAGERSASFANELARIVLEQQETPPLPQLAQSGPESDHALVAATKLRVRADPRDSLAWVDLALCYTNQGKFAKARRCITAALSLQPDNRFVLRSATRFFVHVDEPDRAHSILRKSAATPHDPWLLAAEIAVASILKKPPAFFSAASRLANSANYGPLHLSELLAAIGTRHLGDGDHKKARRAFQLALSEPTENAVAQAGCAVNQGLELDFDAEATKAPRSFEAQAMSRYFDGRWSDSVARSLEWLKDQPFSSRPAIHASYVSSVALEDYETAERVVVQSLMANPKDPVLLNNLAFTLASTDRLEEAEKVFNMIDKGVLDIRTRAVWSATAGLLHFRRGRIELGRQAYLAAIDLSAGRNSSVAALAAVYLAREENLARSNRFYDALAIAERLVKAAPLPEIQSVLERLQRKAR